MVWHLPPAKEAVSIGVTLGLLAALGFSGHVRTVDLIISGVCLGYSLLLSSLAFPPLPHLKSHGLTPGQQFRHPSSPAATPLFKRYMGFFGLVGVLLPVAFVAVAWIKGDTVAMTEGCSYLFPLLTQISAERFLARTQWTSLPGFLFLAAWFTACRVIRTAQWCQRLLIGAPIKEVVTSLSIWMTAEHVLAPLLLAMWSFNLFVFLFFIAIPFAFKCYLLGLPGTPPEKAEKTQ